MKVDSKLAAKIKNGDYIIVLLSSNIANIEGENRFIDAISDITERNKVEHQLKKSKTDKNKTRHYVKFYMVPEFSNIQARRLKPLVEKYSRKYRISKSLVFAVIKTESAFNPFAVPNAVICSYAQLLRL